MGVDFFITTLSWLGCCFFCFGCCGESSGGPGETSGCLFTGFTSVKLASFVLVVGVKGGTEVDGIIPDMFFEVGNSFSLKFAVAVLFGCWCLTLMVGFLLFKFAS